MVHMHVHSAISTQGTNRNDLNMRHIITVSVFLILGTLPMMSSLWQLQVARI